MINGRLLAFSLVCIGILGTAELFSADDSAPAFRKSTHTYKIAGDLPIELDAYVPEAAADAPRPVAVWFHGGALIMGNRESFNADVRDGLVAAGCVFVSVDYRLAPETRLSGVIEDVEDVFRWLRGEGAEKLHVDPARIAVLGSSAGGYLTLTSGFRVSPRPKVLVAFWGYGELVGPWYSEPSTHARHQKNRLSAEEAWSQVGGPAVSDARKRQGNGGKFYEFCRQHGAWPKAVSGWDPRTEKEKFVPYMPLYNVTADFPPTLLIHGTEDTDVPYEESKLMVEQFEKHNVQHRLLTVPGAEHGLAGADRATIKAANRDAVEFVLKHIGK